jgi:hypothetical protein
MPQEGTSMLDRIAERADLYRGISSAVSSWELTRVLPQGYEFDSRLDVTCRSRSPQLTDLELRIRRRDTETVLYRAEVGEQGIGNLRYASRSGPGAGAAAPGVYQEVAVAADTPLAIGDLRIRDVVDLHRALQLHRVRYLGTLDTLNAVQLRVFEVPLGAPAAAPRLGKGQDQDYQAHAMSALLYFEPVELLPRTIRFFDQGERLVRTYSDLLYSRARAGEGNGDLRLTSFRVDSLPTESSTRCRLDSLQVRRR